MARIVMADDGIEFDGTTPERQPLGGAESAYVSLAAALAARGHQVTAYSRCAAPLTHAGVEWRPVAEGLPRTADLYIANRSHHLILRVPRARAAVFWIHNPARYLMKPRYLWRLAWRRPPIVFIGEYHATTYPAWAPGGRRVVIPYGLPELFRTAAPAAEPPPMRAIFTSNPLRGLDWLLDLWTRLIWPRVRGAELHVFSGPSTYGSAGMEKAQAMDAVLNKARGLADKGVVMRAPVGKQALLDELIASRVMLYRGDENETFCLALGEAQAVGLPCVVKPIGSVVERVRHGETGHIAQDDEDFALATLRILRDDELWKRLQANAIRLQRDLTWDRAAAAFEAFLPGAAHG